MGRNGMRMQTLRDLENWFEMKLKMLKKVVIDFILCVRLFSSRSFLFVLIFGSCQNHWNIHAATQSIYIMPSMKRTSKFFSN